MDMRTRVEDLGQGELLRPESFSQVRGAGHRSKDDFIMAECPCWFTLMVQTCQRESLHLVRMCLEDSALASLTF